MTSHLVTSHLWKLMNKRSLSRLLILFTFLSLVSCASNQVSENEPNIDVETRAFR